MTLDRVKLTKEKFEQFLSQKFTKYIAHKFLEPLELHISFSFEEFCDLFERLINYGKDTLLKIVFKIFDYDTDGLITLHDLLNLLRDGQIGMYPYTLRMLLKWSP